LELLVENPVNGVSKIPDIIFKKKRRGDRKITAGLVFTARIFNLSLGFEAMLLTAIDLPKKK